MGNMIGNMGIGGNQSGFGGTQWLCQAGFGNMPGFGGKGFCGLINKLNIMIYRNI
jgi:hypothetical protein